MTRKTDFDKSLDPFARLVTPEQELGEVSLTEDRQEEEAAALKGFIPDETLMQAVDTHINKVIQMPSTGVEDTHAEAHEDTIFNNASMVTPPLSGNGEAPRSLKASPEPEPTDKEEEKKPEYKDEEILPMLDSLLTVGYVKETFKIRSATVTLRSQFFWEDQLVVDMMNERVTEDTLRATGNFYFQVYALAANLESFGGNYFKPLRQADPATLRKSLEDRVNFLMTLPSIMITYLFNKRAEFILKLNYITENFERLVKAF